MELAFKLATSIWNDAKCFDSNLMQDNYKRARENNKEDSKEEMIDKIVEEKLRNNPNFFPWLRTLVSQTFYVFCRLKVENAALKESMSNLEHLTSKVHRLHISLLKVRDDAEAIGSSENMELLKSIMAEANQVKTALSSSLPLSWSVDPTVASITYDSLCEPSDGTLEQPRSSDRVVCSAEIEMVEILILAAELFKEKAEIITSS